MGKFYLVWFGSAIVFLFIVVAALFYFGMLGLYGQIFDVLVGGTVGIFGIVFGGMIAIRNT